MLCCESVGRRTNVCRAKSNICSVRATARKHSFRLFIIFFFYVWFGSPSLTHTHTHTQAVAFIPDEYTVLYGFSVCSACVRSRFSLGIRFICSLLCTRRNIHDEWRCLCIDNDETFCRFSSSLLRLFSICSVSILHIGLILTITWVPMVMVRCCMNCLDSIASVNPMNRM